MMKKVTVAIILLFCINTMAFSLYESWFSAEFEYGNLFEKTTADNQRIELYMGSPGFGIDSFQFWDNFGFIINISFLFPQNISLLDDEYKCGNNSQLSIWKYSDIEYRKKRNN